MTPMRLSKGLTARAGAWVFRDGNWRLTRGSLQSIVAGGADRAIGSHVGSSTVANQ
jgi:hypothetical protein